MAQTLFDNIQPGYDASKNILDINSVTTMGNSEDNSGGYSGISSDMTSVGHDGWEPVDAAMGQSEHMFYNQSGQLVQSSNNDYYDGNIGSEYLVEGYGYQDPENPNDMDEETLRRWRQKQLETNESIHAADSVNAKLAASMPLAHQPTTDEKWDEGRYIGDEEYYDDEGNFIGLQGGHGGQQNPFMMNPVHAENTDSYIERRQDVNSPEWQEYNNKTGNTFFDKLKNGWDR
tara:strand:- start:23891 stop:24583 length:693 start_codon:yes stop_codon:yes gene_type:complete